MDIINTIMNNLIGSRNIIALVAAFIYIVVAIFFIMKMKRNKEEEKMLMSDVEELREKEDIKKNISMLSFERGIYKLFKIEDNKLMIMLIRVGFLTAVGILGIMFHLLTIFFAFEVIMILITAVQDKELEDEIGVSRTERINKFLDYYIPTVASGTSVRQTMQNFIANFGDKDILDWFYGSESDKKIPREWEEIINIYNSGLESEESGLPDKAYLYQEEVDRLMSYFNNYKSKIGEISPICYCYYIGVPIICIMSYNNLPDAWSGGLGIALVVVLCLLFFTFNRLIQKQKSDCCEKIF